MVRNRRNSPGAESAEWLGRVFFAPKSDTGQMHALTKNTRKATFIQGNWMRQWDYRTFFLQNGRRAAASMRRRGLHARKNECPTFNIVIFGKILVHDEKRLPNRIQGQ
jgi:hypothetical protein